MQTTYEYDREIKIAYTYIDNSLVAQLDIDSDIFEQLDGKPMIDSEEYDHREGMLLEYESDRRFVYDIRFDETYPQTRHF